MTTQKTEYKLSENAMNEIRAQINIMSAAINSPCIDKIRQLLDTAQSVTDTYPFLDIAGYLNYSARDFASYDYATGVGSGDMTYVTQSLNIALGKLASWFHSIPEFRTLELRAIATQRRDQYEYSDFDLGFVFAQRGTPQILEQKNSPGWIRVHSDQSHGAASRDLINYFFNASYIQDNLKKRMSAITK